jgi:mRNA-degrading endonuclease YafQ of YafQ-DinJ toxin-antitoxin module
MKPIRRTKRFIRHYRERIARNNQLRQEFVEAVGIFLYDPTAVNDHALRGKMSRDRAFSINDEYRVIYADKEDHYLFKDVGTHEQVYYW